MTLTDLKAWKDLEKIMPKSAEKPCATCLPPILTGSKNFPFL